ncbi:aminotransferase class V-fold PLP-dependent enzyme [Salisediminibacterium halotolerans]|uniref:Cysteine desulfurase family protein n=1 Tax=Salisediminibacterium halotolerans TaxID=517425 RepID=A0A1H9WIN7_9BACI|nr:aminotransferase class V-fold PLP-dependent enzyme [Salisediminibacterium haloalkalitolerans]SES33725.1 cysteine desulfurase family protein [Salisediminibacterium haloalkalitolerans]
MYYFDHAASSYPKPASVAEAMKEAVNDYGANPGRSGHRLSKTAFDKVEQTRKLINEMFGGFGKDRVLFSLNATTALNQAVEGLQWEAGDRIIATDLEHNAVRRPLERLKKERGVEIDFVYPENPQNSWAEVISESLCENTKLVIVTHGSNVTGECLPIEDIGAAVKNHPALFCVDASQTAGVVPIDAENNNLDMLAFPGHKGLLGPQGTGVLLVREGIDLRPLIAGGTGSRSEDAEQPNEWPIGWESGTMNTPGIAGLAAGIAEVNRLGPAEIRRHENELACQFILSLEQLSGVEIIGPGAVPERLGVVSFRIDGVDSNELGLILDSYYNTAVRAGLHCSPLTHARYGTVETGLVRVSFGVYHSSSDVDYLTEAIVEIQQGLQGN